MNFEANFGFLFSPFFSFLTEGCGNSADVRTEYTDLVLFLMR